MGAGGGPGGPGGPGAPAALCVAAGGAGAPLAVGTEGGGVRLWDPRVAGAGAGAGFPGLGEVPAVCFHPAADGRRLFAGAGARVLELDLRRAGSGAGPVRAFEWSRDEVNQVAVNSKGTLLAAADDSGEVVVVDLGQGELQKRLRGGHDNICGSVQFRLRRPWEVVSGGLDCRVVRWDFAKGRAVGVLPMEGGSGGDDVGGGRVFNPPMAHSVSTAGARDVAHLVAVGRGDGVVGVYDLDAETRAPKAGVKAAPPKRCLFGREAGGHRSGVSHATFLELSGEHRVLSVGNDRRLILWDWQAEPGADRGPKIWEARHNCVANWACPVPGTHSVAVADVTGDVRLYALDSPGGAG